MGPRLPGGRRLHVTSIDLNAQDDNVIQADFFDFAKEQLTEERDSSSGGRYDGKYTSNPPVACEF